VAGTDHDSKPVADAGVEHDLLERLSVATAAAGLTCWEFSYVTNRFTWLKEPGGEAVQDIDVAHHLTMRAIHPEDTEMARIATLKALHDGAQSLSLRMRRFDRDGKLQHIQVYQRFIRDADGRPVRALGATREITEEVLAEERLKQQAAELHEAQRRLERASFSVQEGHWELDRPANRHWASSNYYALLGYAPGEIALETKEAIREIIHPDDAERVAENSRKFVNEGGDQDVELRIRCKGGGYRWFRLRGSAQRDEKGVAQLLSGSIQDIQRQKRAEDELRETKERFERAIHGTQDGLWEVDISKGEMWLSPRLHEILGYQPGELGNARNALRNLVHPDDLPISDAAVRKNIDEHCGIDMELRMRTKSGVYRWFRMKGTPDHRGHLHRASGSLQDVTEAHEARDALIRASEAAQAANRAKSAFLANVSHEIRTPMNGIIGMTSLLLDTTLDRTQRDYADTIRGSADSLLSVINDLLDFSKIEAGKLDIDSIEMDLPGNVEDVGTTMAFQAAAKGLELIINVHPDVPARVMGDPQRIRQCLINLLGNAVKFTATGEIAAEVSVVARYGHAVSVRFEVRDSGIGIAPEKIANLFEPFVQADSSTTRHFGGTGLGLSIVRRLVEMMGGQVGADSVLGKGSRFWFTLPMQQVAAVAAEPETAAAKRSGRRVLVVDDNETNRRVLSSHLTHAGFDVKLASNGREALTTLRASLASSRPFDLVIADFQMPDMDGAMLGEQINADPHLSRARVVLLTSMDRHGDIRRFAAMGFAGYLSKPVKARELLMCLDRVLAREAHDFHAQTHPIVTANALHGQLGSRRFSGRVLLVEDNVVNQKVARRFLERLGCEVAVAENGAVSLTALEQGEFQLVLMDVQMPVMDGYTATREIRDRERGKRRIPIVALTANAMTGQLERCLEAGMDALLTKPLAVEALQDVLERYGLAMTDSNLNDAAVDRMVSSPAESPPLDVAQLRELCGDDAEFIQSIAESFASSSTQLVAALRAGAASGDGSAISKAAHALKGASANLYAEKCRDLAAELEHENAKLSKADIESRITRLSREIERVCAALNAMASPDSKSAVG
jgi:PAS domain S-box-containing protein